MFDKGIIYNQDSNSLLCPIGRDGCTLTVEEMENYASQFKGSHMTDIMLCLTDTGAVFPSKTRTSYLDKYYQKIENGKAVDYSKVPHIAAAHHIYEVLGIDHIEVEIRTFREIGINPWISFRMNDIHDLNAETSVILTDFFHEHPEVRRVKYHPEFHFDNNDFSMDYANPLVREYMLAFIEESLDRYDAHGVELDYTREIEVFANGLEYEGLDIMTQFIRDVYALCGKYGEKYGHKVKLAVRVAPGVEQNYEFGLDVMQWAQEGMIDLVTISGRFESNDNDMPIRLWKTLLKPYGTMLAAGFESAGIKPERGTERFGHTFETNAAFVASAYSQGADRVYYYNAFQDFQAKPIDLNEQVDSNGHGGKGVVYSNFGDFEKTLNFNRRHIWSINDRQPVWRRNRFTGSQLPFTTDHGGSFKITVGEIPEGARMTVRVGFKDTEKAIDNPPRVFVNSEKCTYIGTAENDRIPGNTVLCYEVPETAHKYNVHAYVAVDELTTIDYVEAFIKVSR